jgi:hypothetical protein
VDHPNDQHLAQLGPIARKVVARRVSQDEIILDLVLGDSGQCLVSLVDRLLVIKPPGLLAGAADAKTATFPYDTITALEVNMGMITGSVEVIAAGYDGKGRTQWWASQNRDQRDPFRLSNTIPISRGAAKRQADALDRIRQRILDAHSKALPATTVGTVSVADELAKLVALRDQGVLTPEEFELQKRRLLD